MSPIHRRSRHIRWLAMPLIFTVIMAAAFCSPGDATAAEAANVGAKISKEQATQAALQTLPGRVTDVTIEKKRGKTVYVIEIVADKDGAETDVLVDMTSGAVLGMDH